MLENAKVRATIAHAGLGALVAGGLWLALGAASNDLLVDTNTAPEPGWLTGPLAGWVGGITDTGFSFALILMLGGYALVVALSASLRPCLALGGVGLVALAFVLAPVLMSSDVFHYVGFARIAVLHGLNPYAHTISEVPNDPVLPLVYWRTIQTPYGPLFTVASYALAHRSIPFAVWSLKALAGLGWLGSMGLAWRCAGQREAQSLRAALIVGANPLLLAYGVGGAHNDLIVLALVLGGMALAGAQRTRGAGAALMAGAAIKATGGIVLVFALIGDRRRRALGRGAAMLAAPVVIVSFVLFGPRLLDTVVSIATTDRFRIDYTFPDLAGRMLGTGATTGVRIAFGLGLVGALALVGLAWRRGMGWLDAAGWATLALLCAIASFVPWYVAWVLPMAALSRSRRLLAAVMLFTAIVVVIHLPLLGFPAYQ